MPTGVPTLDVLGNLAGSIAGPTGSAGVGLAGGLLEGERERRRAETEAVERYVRMLQGQAFAQRLGQPTIRIGGDRMLIQNPNGSYQVIELPLTSRERSTQEIQQGRINIDLARLNAELERLRAATQKPTPAAAQEYLDARAAWFNEHPGSTETQFQEWYKGLGRQPRAEPETERAIGDYLSARGLPDTPANRDHARAELAARTAGARAAAVQAERPNKLDEPLLERAAQWSDAQGRHPLPSDTPRTAMAKGANPFKGKEPPEVAAATTLMSIDQVLSLIPALRRKNLLMDRPGVVPYLSTWFGREVVRKGDEDLTAFHFHTSTLVRTARQLGDIGFRAQAAIVGMTNLIEKATTATGLEKALHQLRNLVGLTAPATMPRTFTFWDTNATTYRSVTFEPGETLDDLLRTHPEFDPSR